MKEIPILFSALMVRAILEGRKTQTRRILKFKELKHYNKYHRCDTLWVRETFGKYSGRWVYRAIDNVYDIKWKPSIFMPRAASRISLKITDVKTEQLQEITEADARAEGFKSIADFKNLWDKLNEKRGYGWEKNPFVYAITFERIK